MRGESGQTKVAIYARVSTKDQNCDRQIADLVTYAERANFTIVKIYKETASGAKNERQERKSVINLARNRRIDAVLVTEMSRWGRSTIDLINTLQELNGYGVSLIAQTGLNFDLSTPAGKMMASIMASVSEFEREIICERVRSGLASARAKGKVFGRKVLDVTDRCIKVNELRSAGKSEREIGRELNLGKSTVNKCPRCPSLPEGMDW